MRGGQGMLLFISPHSKDEWDLLPRPTRKCGQWVLAGGWGGEGVFALAGLILASHPLLLTLSHLVFCFFFSMGLL